MDGGGLIKAVAVTQDSPSATGGRGGRMCGGQVGWGADEHAPGPPENSAALQRGAGCCAAVVLPPPEGVQRWTSEDKVRQCPVTAGGAPPASQVHKTIKITLAAASAAAMLQPVVRAAEQHQIGHRPRGGTHGMEWVTTQGPVHCFPDTTTGSGCGNPVAPRPYRCARPLVQETLGPDINAVAACTVGRGVARTLGGGQQTWTGTASTVNDGNAADCLMQRQGPHGTESGAQRGTAPGPGRLFSGGGWGRALLHVH
eukprot:CAMPEP_0174325866 /NCGR_PEP_ID=MMETSP0810-20121108/13533_1 /TAXON_ID=73025 ORGANISM="Eutreptiella gymnastica-like, Strain CCMP1594" /NCGR_SAMPLE_ID=MMETSP0810 /ASSEMBLY_ACC=CAM_ASM_000659 /LENGTH=255 /DNA_ID=CAMNT_0015439317 /DNA_START=132 /DNA_END=902 /DNA_ORIENTATION=-